MKIINFPSKKRKKNNSFDMERYMKEREEFLETLKPKLNADDFPTREEKIEKVLEMISLGYSANESCKALGIPTSTFNDNVNSAKYKQARDLGAIAQFRQMHDFEIECLKGNIDPVTMRVIMDSRKWRLARMRPDVFGETLNVNHSGSIDITKRIIESRRKMIDINKENDMPLIIENESDK